MASVLDGFTGKGSERILQGFRNLYTPDSRKRNTCEYASPCRHKALVKALKSQ